MSRIDRILNAIGLSRNKEIKKTYYRNFVAAMQSRLRANWTATRIEINNEIKNDLPALRARARDLRLNNPIVAGAVIDNRVNIVGPNGFDLQPMVKFFDGSSDQFANDVIKKAFDKWSVRKYASASQRLSFLMIQYLAIDHLFIDGEIILRIITDKKVTKDNPFGFTLDFIDPNDVDHDKNENLPNGNTILMGVEIDEWRRLKAIWVKDKDKYNELYSFNGGNSKRISAEEIIFVYDPLHFKAVHGITPLAPVMTTLKDLDMWEDYSLQNAKASAAKMGFLKKPLDAIYDYQGADEVEGETSSEPDAGKYMDFEGGTVEELPAGYEFQAFTPEFPHAQHAEFVRNNGRKIATGIGRDYTSLFGDRENESYSSARSGELKQRATYSYLQSIIREQMLIPIYENWLKFALLNGQLEPLRMSDIERYKDHWWQGYVKPWVDMQKEIDAQKAAEEAGYISKIQIVSQMGNRYEDVLADKKKEQELRKKFGVEDGNTKTN